MTPIKSGWYWARWRGYGEPWIEGGAFLPTRVGPDYRGRLSIPNHSRGHGDPMMEELIWYEWGPACVPPAGYEPREVEPVCEQCGGTRILSVATTHGLYSETCGTCTV
jgi:hypothetical protein